MAAVDKSESNLRSLPYHGEDSSVLSPAVGSDNAKDAEGCSGDFNEHKEVTCLKHHCQETTPGCSLPAKYMMRSKLCQLDKCQPRSKDVVYLRSTGC